MEIIVFEKQAYYKMVEEMKKAVKDAAKNGKEVKEWLSTSEVKELLGFKSKSKMQQLRDSGDILFSQHGRTIKYSQKSIVEFLERNII